MYTYVFLFCTYGYKFLDSDSLGSARTWVKIVPSFCCNLIKSCNLIVAPINNLRNFFKAGDGSDGEILYTYFYYLAFSFTNI